MGAESRALAGAGGKREGSREGLGRGAAEEKWEQARQGEAGARKRAQGGGQRELGGGREECREQRRRRERESGAGAGEEGAAGGRPAQASGARGPRPDLRPHSGPGGKRRAGARRTARGGAGCRPGGDRAQGCGGARGGRSAAGGVPRGRRARSSPAGRLCLRPRRPPTPRSCSARVLPSAPTRVPEAPRRTRCSRGGQTRLSPRIFTRD